MKRADLNALKLSTLLTNKESEEPVITFWKLHFLITVRSLGTKQAMNCFDSLHCNL